MTRTTEQVIVGMGEVGNALFNIFPNATAYDTNGAYGVLPMRCWALHICFPYNGTFIEQVKHYQNKCNPHLTIIHSSVPVGTSDKLKAVYSPVRGVHPNLEGGIRTFVKYIAGGKAYEAAKLFQDVGITTRVLADTRTLEAAKLWDTTMYGLSILMEKEIYAWCRENQVDFEIVYREFTQTYNDGYAKLGMAHVMRPWLMHMEGKIGGHCVLPNAVLLDSPSAKRLIKENSKL